MKFMNSLGRFRKFELPTFSKIAETIALFSIGILSPIRPILAATHSPDAHQAFDQIQEIIRVNLSSHLKSCPSPIFFRNLSRAHFSPGADDFVQSDADYVIGALDRRLEQAKTLWIKAETLPHITERHIQQADQLVIDILASLPDGRAGRLRPWVEQVEHYIRTDLHLKNRLKLACFNPLPVSISFWTAGLAAAAITQAPGALAFSSFAITAGTAHCLSTTSPEILSTTVPSPERAADYHTARSLLGTPICSVNLHERSTAATHLTSHLSLVEVPEVITSDYLFMIFLNLYLADLFHPHQENSTSHSQTGAPRMPTSAPCAPIQSSRTLVVARTQSPLEELPAAPDTAPDNCVICLEPNSLDSNNAISTPCAHRFHPHCLRRWIRTQGEGARCPICRSLILDKKRSL